MFSKKPVPDRNIDFIKRRYLSPSSLSKQKKHKKPVYTKLLFIAVFIIIGFFAFSNKIIVSSTDSSFNFTKGGILTQIKNIITKREYDIAGASNNRINILLLGIGGPGHQGANLTDSIIIASIKPQEKEAALLSIPRDLYVYNKDLGGSKINALYALGESQGKKQGGELVKKVVSETFGIDIHYFARVNFDGFTKFIDALGGIDVFVDHAFIDQEFPAENFKTKVVSFKHGMQQMNGITALQFSRSRHGTNGEGSDFARAKRQQKVLLAVKEKVLKLGIILRPDKISKILQILGQTLETDMELWEVTKIAKLAGDIASESVTQKIMDNSPGGPLREITGADGSYLLVPKRAQELKHIAQNIFELNTVKNEKPKIIIQNGTTIPGFAQETELKLEQNGFKVFKIENAEKQSYSKTVVYDLTHGQKKVSLKQLEVFLSANVSSYIPANLWRENMEADFLVILGSDQITVNSN